MIATESDGGWMAVQTDARHPLDWMVVAIVDSVTLEHAVVVADVHSTSAAQARQR